MDPRVFLIVLAKIPVVLIVIDVVEQGDPLAELGISILHEQFLRDADRADLVLIAGGV